jgi:hypothetical protein
MAAKFLQPYKKQLRRLQKYKFGEIILKLNSKLWTNGQTFFFFKSKCEKLIKR